jgi:hypothetical protein
MARELGECATVTLLSQRPLMLGIKPLDPQCAFVGGDVSEMHVVIRLPWDDEKQRLAELLTLCQYFLKQCYLHAHAPLGFGGYKHNNVELGTQSCNVVDTKVAI